MSKFKIERTVALSIPASFQRELAEFSETLEKEGLDFHLSEIIETIINKASKTDKFEYYTNVDTVYIQYREEE